MEQCHVAKQIDRKMIAVHASLRNGTHNRIDSLRPVGCGDAVFDVGVLQRGHDKQNGAGVEQRKNTYPSQESTKRSGWN